MYSAIFFITIRNVNVIPLDYKASSDSHLYEDIELYQNSDIASNKEQDISTVACPAYVTNCTFHRQGPCLNLCIRVWNCSTIRISYQQTSVLFLRINFLILL